MDVSRVRRAAAVMAALPLLVAGVTACGLELPGAKKKNPVVPAMATSPVPRGTPFDATPGYVALGDSFASGLGIAPQVAGSPKGCGRSEKNYPHAIAARKNISAFTDVTCSGATTADLSAGQRTSGSPPPQLDALRPDTALVTLGIGGNDIGFSRIVETCVTEAMSVTSLKPCTDHYTEDGVDVLADRVTQTAPKIADAVAAIKQRSPRARIVLVGYPAILSDDTLGCVTQAPFHPGDLPYLREVIARLNTMLRDTASAAGAEYVDVEGPSKGHDVCRPSGERWVEGVRPEPKGAATMHPNALGHEAVAQLVLDRLG